MRGCPDISVGDVSLAVNDFGGSQTYNLEQMYHLTPTPTPVPPNATGELNNARDHAL